MRFTLLTGVVCLGTLFACTASTKNVVLTDDGDGGTTLPDDGKSPSSSSSSSSSGSTGGSICEQVCAKAASANCSKQSTCVADCEKDQKSIPAACQSQADDANQCALKKATGFKCNASGKAVVSGGCDTEAKALVDCVLNGSGNGGSGGSSGGSSGGNATCGGLTSGDATCDTCVNANCCSQGDACGNDNECLAILNCFGNCSDQTCLTNCETQHPTGKAHEQAFFSCLSTSCKSACGN